MNMNSFTVLPIGEILDYITDDLETKILRELDDYTIVTMGTTSIKSLIDSFSWEDSLEGPDYWDYIDDNIDDYIVNSPKLNLIALRPVSYWLSKLKEPYRSDIVPHISLPWSEKLISFNKFISIFTWEDTPEGYEYWHSLYKYPFKHLIEYNQPQSHLPEIMPDFSEYLNQYPRLLCASALPISDDLLIQYYMNDLYKEGFAIFGNVVTLDKFEIKNVNGIKLLINKTVENNESKQ